MAIGLKVELRNARLNVVRDAIDAGAAAGTLKIYAGTRPVTGAAVTTQTLLATCTFGDPSAADAAAGVLTFNAITGANAVADGTATWARAADSDGTFVMDMDVGVDEVGATETILLNTVNLVTGGPVSVNSGTLTAGNA